MSEQRLGYIKGQLGKPSKIQRVRNWVYNHQEIIVISTTITVITAATVLILKAEAKNTARRLEAHNRMIDSLNAAVEAQRAAGMAIYPVNDVA